MRPAFNQHFGSFSSRYVLGIEGVAPSMQSNICPVVTTVTPRPYYWAFFTWANYDYYQHEDLAKQSFEKLNDYISKTNYCIACGALINGYRGVNNFTGSDMISGRGWADLDPVSYHSEYVKGISTMSNYISGISAGIATMNLVINENLDTGETYKRPTITLKGEHLAKAFEKVIQKTVYYQKYRFNTVPIPRDVLIELGQALRIDMSTLPECRELLKEYLFETERLKKLQECKKYLDFIHKDTGNDFTELKRIREFLYDRYSSKGNANSIPDEYQGIAGEWEIIIGRHYFTVGLQMIFKYMTEVLTEPLDLETWIKLSMEEEVAPFSLDQTLESIIDQQNFDHAQREFMADKARRHTSPDSVWNGLQLMLSVYNRFSDRDDLSDTARQFYLYGSNDDSISLQFFFDKVDDYMNKPVRDFAVYVLRNLVVRQHMDTAFMKMIRNNVDGFYVEKIGNQYRRRYVFDFAFQGLRLEELASVMKDLRCF